jgi:antitoxin (DNA-binding transcriptional repressor) of toxin-antitoxin stability system
MRSVSISVTEASRNFADCINRARYQGTTFILHKNGVVVARIVPEQKSKTEEELGAEPAGTAASAEEVRVQSNAAEARPKERPREIW